MLSDNLTVTPIEGTDPNQHVYALEGPVTLGNLFTLQEALNSPAPVLILDLTGVPYIDSSGVGALVRSVVLRKKLGHRLVLTAPNASVRKLFSLTNVGSLLETYPSLEEAK